LRRGIRVLPGNTEVDGTCPPEALRNHHIDLIETRISTLLVSVLHLRGSVTGGGRESRGYVGKRGPMTDTGTVKFNDYRVVGAPTQRLRASA
jgi:hypothetical protein